MQERLSEEGAEGVEDEEKGGILGRTVGAILGVAPEVERETEAEERPGQPEQAAEMPEQPGPEPQADAGDRTNLNQATFEQLRDVGFSVTQATRVITYRARQNGFSSLDDLADVPGMPGPLLREIKSKLTL